MAETLKEATPTLKETGAQAREPRASWPRPGWDAVTCAGPVRAGAQSSPKHTDERRSVTRTCTALPPMWGKSPHKPHGDREAEIDLEKELSGYKTEQFPQERALWWGMKKGTGETEL